MLGKILQVNLSSGGLPKRAVARAVLHKNGFVGDSFRHPRIHGGPQQAVLLIAQEILEDLVALGYPVYPGALGENVTTVGVNPKLWRSGQQFHAGSARIELTKPRSPCKSLDVYGSGQNGVPIQNYLYDLRVRLGDASSETWGRGGFYARVTQPGELAPGDTLALESGTGVKPDPPSLLIG